MTGLFYYRIVCVTPPKDIPNSVLGKILSFEFLGMIVVLGVAWGTLTTKVNSLENHVEDAKVQQSEQVNESKKVTDDLSKEVNQINRKVDVLGNNQEHFKRQIESVDDRLEKIQDLLENGR
jgi:predicted  nucleic acid-binding Zn-ribbon protein